MAYTDRTIYLTRDSFCMGDDVMDPNIVKYTWRDCDWHPETNMYMLAEAYLGANLPGYFWRGYSSGKRIMDVDLRMENYSFSRKVTLADNWQELLRENCCIHFLNTGNKGGDRGELPLTIDKGYYSFEEAAKIFEEYYPAHAWDNSYKPRNDRKEHRGVYFEIIGGDYKSLKRFTAHHHRCHSGFAGDKFSYSFVPTGLGTAVTVTCSCGQKLFLGDFMDKNAPEYDPADHPILTEQDRINARFEEDAYAILFLENPRYYRISMGTEQSFEMLYAYACGVLQNSDERLMRSFLYKYGEFNGNGNKDNYKGLSDEEKIKKFYKHFKKHVREEVRKYDCKNKKLLEMLK